MLRKDLGALMSRAVAMLGLFALLRELLTIVPGTLMAFGGMPSRTSWMLDASAIVLMGLLCIASLTVVAFLWRRADDFGSSESHGGTSEGLVFDGPGVRSAIIFGLGLYFAAT